MNPSTWDRLDREFDSYPIMKASDTPSEEEIAEAAAELDCCFDGDFIDFVRRYGGAIVGSLPVFGLRPAPVMGKRWSIVEVTKWYRDQGLLEMANCCIISEDGSGNPIGLTPEGEVVLFDHDTGGVSSLSDSFEEFLVGHCLEGVG